jgi:hypothetical protein
MYYNALMGDVTKQLIMSIRASLKGEHRGKVMTCGFDLTLYGRPTKSSSLSGLELMPQE